MSDVKYLLAIPRVLKANPSPATPREIPREQCAGNMYCEGSGLRSTTCIAPAGFRPLLLSQTIPLRCRRSISPAQI